MKTIIHVNQHKIKSNAKNNEREPVLTCKTYKDNTYGHEAEILDNKGNVTAKVIYSPDKPLSCGAKVWIETQNLVRVITNAGNQDNSHNTQFEWTDDLVKEFARVYSLGSYGEYRGLKKLDDKLERFKELKTSQICDIDEK